MYYVTVQMLMSYNFDLHKNKCFIDKIRGTDDRRVLNWNYKDLMTMDGYLSTCTCYIITHKVQSDGLSVNFVSDHIK